MVSEPLFTKKQRLLKSSDFTAIKGSKLTASSKELLLLAKVNSYNHARLGLVVPKRHIKTAVKRNIIKRIVRESFRHQASTLPNLDVILLIRASINQLDKKTLRQCIDDLWLKLIKRCH
jgi:ribonuclease P protein component